MSEPTHRIVQMLTKLSEHEGSSIRIVLEVPDYDELQRVLKTISDTDIHVKTEDIIPTTLSARDSVTIDLSILTEKQREALELAFDRGYYKRPRETDLGELASQLGISKSAVSQRLRNAEMNLIKSAVNSEKT